MKKERKIQSATEAKEDVAILLNRIEKRMESPSQNAM